MIFLVQVRINFQFSFWFHDSSESTTTRKIVFKNICWKIEALNICQIFKMNQARPKIFILNFTDKIVHFSEIQTRIFRGEGERADHLTTTTAP